MASFSESVFIDWIGGEEAYLDYIKDNRKDVWTSAHSNDGGYFPVHGIMTELTCGDHVYNKGADVAHNQRLLLGDDVFFSALDSFEEEHPFSSITSEQLRDHLDQLSSESVSAHFYPMIFNPG
ncbi:MAG: aminopeptidase N [Litorivivens sp.]|jgi:aminopeptidase N